MPAYICTTCGTQYAPTPQPPASCPICLDERQYVTPAGQIWTTLDVLARRSMNAIHELEPGLISLLTFPHFGIPGMLAYLPAKFRIRFLEPIPTDQWGEAPWEDTGLVQTVAQEIRSQIQENLYDMLARRTSVWFG